MNGNNKQNLWVMVAFGGFSGLLVLINAALTFAFGYTYLGAAFGDGMLSSYGGGIYTLLLLDAAYVVWFYVFLRLAVSTHQRSLSVGMAGLSLIGSLFATLQQLATNATALVDLTAYHQSVGMAAFVMLLIMTAAHILASASYLLLDPREKVRQMRAVVRGIALEDSLNAAEKMIAFDHQEIVSAMSANVRTDVLASLGFTGDLQQIAAPMELQSANDDHLVADEPVLPTNPSIMAAESPVAPPIVAGDGNFTRPQTGK
ncbi:MAG TPA: hypothetical protein VLL52_17335 [Anaerolineae bacterium]|nr:hypothetical protein [Anaerolineae bacterium]